MHFYLDESGDLGWKFHKPYRRGGSSRFLTIGVLQTPGHKAHLPKRIIKRLSRKFRWSGDAEKKWSEMKPNERREFAVRACKLTRQHPDIMLWAIVVNKQNVEAHIRADANKLYNYMIKLLLLDEMAKHASIRLVPDPRSIKVESGNSLHDYLQTELWLEKEVKTNLVTEPCDSSTNRNVQFADMLSGVIQHHFEDNKSDTYRFIKKQVRVKQLFSDAANYGKKSGVVNVALKNSRGKRGVSAQQAAAGID